MKTTLILLLTFIICSKASDFDAVCGYLAWPPQFPNATQVHAMDWTYGDEFLLRAAKLWTLLAVTARESTSWCAVRWCSWSTTTG